jgi:hypothetical protein
MQSNKRLSSQFSFNKSVIHSDSLSSPINHSTVNDLGTPDWKKFGFSSCSNLSFDAFALEKIGFVWSQAKLMQMMT